MSPWVLSLTTNIGYSLDRLKEKGRGSLGVNGIDLDVTSRGILTT
jgi:hypothetical protein